VWRPNLVSRVLGPGLVATAGVALIGLSAWWPGVIAVAGALAMAIDANQRTLEVGSSGVHYRRILRSFDFAWAEVAGADLITPSFAVREIVVLDVNGHFHRTAIWRWRLPGQREKLESAATAINGSATVLPGVADMRESDLRQALSDYSREALLRTAGLDEKGAEKRSDRMLALWLLTLLVAAAVGGLVGHLSGSFAVGVAVAASLVVVYLVWAARQPRLPPQRQAVRLTFLSKSTRRAEHD